ncbi:helix-turn-helix domain-containing protein [Streptomyces sp. NPDC058783]|uniref:helix-turn-helix domain-containing protein n=1 Tax=Streptomyces sp. NPDC058783 TaxID=3346633 RepID=UPI00367A43EF
MSQEKPGAEPFIAELKRWRDVRGLSQSALAKAVGYTPSYVSKVEGGQQRPARGFAEQADRVLHAGGALRRTFAEIEPHVRSEASSHQSVPDSPESQPASVIVRHDDAELYYDGTTYRATQRRQLYNASPDPIARYLIRISVDRYPGSPEQSNQHYRENPLTWDEIDLTAKVGNEPIGWRVQHDRDAFKRELRPR